LVIYAPITGCHGARVAGVKPEIVAADSMQIEVLRDLIALQSNGIDSLCLDPNVAAGTTSPALASTRRWSDPVLKELLRNPRVAIDTTAGPAPRGAALCARSQRVGRVAYGRPRIVGDAGVVIALITFLNTRALPDSFRFDLTLERRAGTWTVLGSHGWRKNSPAYFDGAGCYRFSHPPFPQPDVTHLRIDTILVRAESTILSADGLPPLRRLLPTSQQIGMGGTSGYRTSYWYASHDTLFLIWSVPNAGLAARLVVAGDSLRGSMEWGTDVVELVPTRVAVIGQRVRCPE
jgi:hypothetical protein